MNKAVLEADVLCVGGGIAGLMAAIRAAELGAKVIVVDKANTMRSGNGTTGNDHFACYIPEFHGPDIKPIVEEVAHQKISGMRPTKFIHTWLAKSFEIAKLWDSWGIPMKPHGDWEFSGHSFPGGVLIALKYAGKDQKLVLNREARSRGVQILNRVMVFDLLHDDGGVVGAIGVGTRDGKMVTIIARSVIMATGACERLYPNITPGWMFNMANSPANTGDGRAMAYRAGAELINMEIPHRWAGPKYFSRCGKGTWVGVIRDPQDKPIGPFVTKPDKRYGDAVADAYTSLFEDYAKSGKGPVYMDCRGISDEDYEYMMWGLKNEGNTAFLNYLEEEGIDIRKRAVEFVTYDLTTRGGIYYDEKAETSVPGLYAAGDEYFGGISAAAVFGWIAGENAVAYARQLPSPDIDMVTGQARGRERLLGEILARQNGASWQEVNIAVQQIMYDYAGSAYSETMLRAGLSHLRRLREKTCTTLMAKNQHELMHCLEVLNLLELGEVVFTAILARQETRGDYIRLDYPFTNPMLNKKYLICKKVSDKPVTEWRDIGVQM